MEKLYLFIDESGDPSFYGNRKKLLVGREGFQPMLNLGLVTLKNKRELRKKIIKFTNQIKADPLYASIYSVAQPNWYLHAKNDHPEVRAKFFEFLRNLEGFKTYIVIGRKRLNTFQNKHNNNESEFYFDLVYHLMKDRLKYEDTYYQIFLSARKNNTQRALNSSIQKAIERDNKKRETALKITYGFDIVRSIDTPELSIVDYMLWALNRYIIKKEVRFFKALQHKYNLIIDLYDIERFHSGLNNNNYYHKNNPFDMTKTSEFKADGYL